jgi:hypothetical protein
VSGAFEFFFQRLGVDMLTGLCGTEECLSEAFSLPPSSEFGIRIIDACFQENVDVDLTISGIC